MTIARTTLWSHVRDALAWLDNANGRSEIENLARMAKIMEELGEAINAHVGYTGQNPRKGKYATVDDIRYELCDVLLSAAVALATWTGDATSAERYFTSYLIKKSAKLSSGDYEREDTE